MIKQNNLRFSKIKIGQPHPAQAYITCRSNLGLTSFSGSLEHKQLTLCYLSIYKTNEKDISQEGSTIILDILEKNM